MNGYDVQHRWGWRCYVLDHQGDEVELTIVRGLDGGAPCPNGKRMFHLFGPAQQAVPHELYVKFDGRVPEDAHIEIEIYTGDDGEPRFKPPFWVMHTGS